MLKYVFFLSFLFALNACSTAPIGPSTLVMPGSDKSFDEFSRDDKTCRGYALNQLNGQTPGKISEQSALSTAALGTAVGAAAGAAFGGRDGAAFGAGTGLLFGGMLGADSGRHEGRQAQTMYDHAYVQCMYGSGHRVPVPANLHSQETRSRSANSPRSAENTPSPSPPPPPSQ